MDLLVRHSPLSVLLLFEGTVQSGDHQRTTWRQQLIGHIHAAANGDLDNQKADMTAVSCWLLVQFNKTYAAKNSEKTKK